jgi:hypothetical protein
MDQHAQGSNLAQAAELSSADASHAAAWLRGSDGDAEQRQKDAESSWNSTGWQRLRQMSRRHERQLAKG